MSSSTFEEFQIILGAITTHAWNGDKSQVALSPNNNEVHIYKKTGSEFALEHVLSEHDKLVTSVDWAPNSNRIVSCSQDRNAYVWTFDEENTKTWMPTLVLLRINRAATFVRWSPTEEMFAVGSGARCVSICHFEEEHNWWISKHVRKPIRSTILSVAWHPDEPIVATGSSDYKARVFSCLIKGYGEKPHGSVWGSDFSFNALLGEYSGGSNNSSGWVHDVAFSPRGNALAWVSHDSSLNVFYPESKFLSAIKVKTLPFLKLLFLAEGTIVAAGHDCTPYIFQGSDGNQWTLIDKISAEAKKSSLASNSAFNKFKQMDSRKQDSASDLALASIHQNSIVDMRVVEVDESKVTKFST